MYEVVNEPIDMVAVFGKKYHDVKPIKFKWGDREYVISKVGYKHRVREGKKIIHILSVTDGTNFFELRFDADDINWTLGRTWDGEAN